MTLFFQNPARRTGILRWATLSLGGLFALSVVFSPAAAVHGQQSATVTGRIVNGTEGSSPPADVQVSLHTFSAGLQGVQTLETVTGASGVFRFEDVPVSDGSGYALSADYQGKTYSLLIGPGDLSQEVSLTVYESTRDVSVIEVDSHAMIITAIDQSERVVEAVEVVALANVSDRTLVPDLANVGPGQFSFLRFSLPEDATDFDIQSDLLGGEIIPVGTGFAVTSPVAPGAHNLTFSYRFPYQGTAFSYRQNLLQGAKDFRLLVPASLGPVQAGGLPAAPAVTVEGLDYSVWQASEVSPAQGLTISLTNLPQPGWTQRAWQTVSDTGLWAIAIPSGLGAVLAAALLYGGLRPQPQAAGAPGRQSGGTVPGPVSQREQLVRQMALLDQRFEAGDLDEASYRSERTMLKDRALSPSSTP